MIKKLSSEMILVFDGDDELVTFYQKLQKNLYIKNLHWGFKFLTYSTSGNSHKHLIVDVTVSCNTEKLE